MLLSIGIFNFSCEIFQQNGKGGGAPATENSVATSRGKIKSELPISK